MRDRDRKGPMPQVSDYSVNEFPPHPYDSEKVNPSGSGDTDTIV